MGGAVVLPCKFEERALRRRVIGVARVVLPFPLVSVCKKQKVGGVPEPGIPEMAIRTRWFGGVDWNLAGLVC
jgi:hypothetical protein